MQLAFEEEYVRALNAAVDIKVVQSHAKLSCNEAQKLCVKVKNVDVSLAKSKGEAQTLMNDLKKKAHWRIGSVVRLQVSQWSDPGSIPPGSP